MKPRNNRSMRLFVVSSCVVFAMAAFTFAKHFGPWDVPTSMESLPGTSSDFNTAFNDGCPYQSPDGLKFFMASNRPGGMGGQDIWIASRERTDDPWGAPINAGLPINSTADDFCPTPIRGNGLFFVSARVHPESCGGADIYFSRLKRGGWTDPENLGCGINSAAGEASPSYFEDDAGNAYLYFSSTRTGGFEPAGSDADIYYSVNFSPAQLAPGVNTAQDDFRPNVRKDGREIFFDSNRPGGMGGQDIWTSIRGSIDEDWTIPTNVTGVNTASNETRASLSWDATQLVFGSNRPGVEGQADIFFTTRQNARGDE
jgi:hypothetical protein